MPDDFTRERETPGGERVNDLSRGKKWILFPQNLNVSRDEVEGNIEIRGKQNSLFPLGPVIKC